MTTEQTGYDELLHSRVKQLNRIEERLEAVLKLLDVQLNFTAKAATIDLRRDVQDMIAVAEAEHANF